MMFITETMMWFIRIGVFWLVMWYMVASVGDMKVTIADNERSRAIVQLAENLLESNLTVARGVFNATALAVLDGNPAEIARLCNFGSGAEFFAYKAGSREHISKFGYAGAFNTSREFPVWLKFDQQLVPGAMVLTVSYTPLDCAVESAWTYKLPQAPVTVSCRWDACVLYTDGDEFCFAEGVRGNNADCRSMPGVSVAADDGYDVYVSKGAHELRAVPVKENGVLACDGPDVGTGPGDYKIGTVLLCEVQQ